MVGRKSINDHGADKFIRVTAVLLSPLYIIITRNRPQPLLPDAGAEADDLRIREVSWFGLRTGSYFADSKFLIRATGYYERLTRGIKDSWLSSCEQINTLSSISIFEDVNVIWTMRFVSLYFIFDKYIHCEEYEKGIL